MQDKDVGERERRRQRLVTFAGAVLAAWLGVIVGTEVLPALARQDSAEEARIYVKSHAVDLTGETRSLVR